MLARMEAVGVAVAVGDLARAGAAVRRRMERLGAAASALLGGRAINLGSSQQLAAVLYDELKLPHPEGIGGEGGWRKVVVWTCVRDGASRCLPRRLAVAASGPGRRQAVRYRRHVVLRTAKPRRIPGAL